MATGWLVTASILVHEVIQEVSDYLVLVRCGFGRWTALLSNFAVATSAFAGFLVAMLADGTSDYSIGLTLAFAGGFFCYVGCICLIPQLLTIKKWWKALICWALWAAGVVVMAILLNLFHVEVDSHGDHSHSEVAHAH
jgi:zinc and cadmium transporter